MRIHLTGIGGVGMAGLAFLLKSRGHEVDGCDLKATPRTRWLESIGIPVSVGHDPAHVEGKDLVVVTPAVAKDNPEFIAAQSRCKCRGEMLAEIVNEAKDSIAVCGSHGKTTTSTFIAKLLIALGENVEWAIGGETGTFPVAGGKGVLVVEADESDGTLALYHAKTLVVTNCEYDHPDHFKTKEDYFACYETAKRNAGQVIEGSEEVRVKSEELRSLISDPNAMLAVRVALARGYTMDQIAAVLPQVTAELPDRRFQKLADGVYTDYGHHPTEIRYSIARSRKNCRGVLRVLFQPHRYSRTAAFLKEFADSLRGADEVVLCPVYSAFEKPVPNGTSADLYKECRELGLNVKLARSCEEAWMHAKRSRKDDDITIIQGAGDILDKIRNYELRITNGGDKVRKIWIGAGTNLVKTDLNLPIEYVKSDSPAGRPGAELLSQNSSLFTLHSSLFPWMAGIPGTIGGWVKMNAGAHGHSISEVIESVKVDGKWISAADCGFGYRTSRIDGEIQDVRFSEEVRVKSEELRSVDYYLSKRKKFPAYTRGSVFKNPEGDFAGRLLEESGCKGLRVGGAYVWSEHANVIVAPPGEATASDFIALSQIMRNRVFFRFGVVLEPEIRGI